MTSGISPESESDNPLLFIVCVVGPTASGKSVRAVELALERNGEVISVDSRQVYRMLDIGAEKISSEEMRGIPHHLIDIRDPKDVYSASDFVTDATHLIKEIHARGKVPILAGGTHFYFDALLYGLPLETPPNEALREELELLPVSELARRVRELDPRRAERIDMQNPRRLVRALEIIAKHGEVPLRPRVSAKYEVEWIILNPSREMLRARLDEREASKFPRGLVEEVRCVRAHVGDKRLSELGLEYRMVGEYLRGERDEASLLPALSRELWQYARRQKAWIRKLAKGTKELQLLGKN